MGDGHLMYKHPQFVYVSFPNVIELSLCLGAATPFLTTWTLLKLALALWLVEIGCDATQAISGPESRHLSPTRRLLAALPLRLRAHAAEARVAHDRVDQLVGGMHADVPRDVDDRGARGVLHPLVRERQRAYLGLCRRKALPFAPATAGDRGRSARLAQRQC